MQAAQRNGYKIMKPSAFTLIPYKPRYHYSILSAVGHMFTQEKEGYLALHFYHGLNKLFVENQLSLQWWCQQY